MNDETVELLREADSGTAMGKDALEEILPGVKDPKLRQHVQESLQEHCDLGNRIHDALNRFGHEGESAKPVARVMAKMKTEWKLRTDGGDRTAAELLSEGADMGIRSVTDMAAKCPHADKDAKKLAEELVKIEEKLSRYARDYLEKTN